MPEMTNALPDWLDVSRETLEKLEFYASEIRRWNPVINLVSKASLADIWARHILDSAQVYPLGNANAGLWLDIGSGGGFPGIVMAIMGAPQMVLVESDQRKATFLRQVSRQLGLDLQVIAKRIDDLPPFGAQTMTARALAALTQLLPYAYTHLAAEGSAIFPKGRQVAEELAVAQAKWRFEHRLVPSRTDTDAALLVIRNIEPR